MSAEPLSREERILHLATCARLGMDVGAFSPRVIYRFDAALRAETIRADAAEATLARVRNALAALDGHTCHEGCTDVDHLAMHRAVVAEVRAALEGAS